jgi:hypothetical protein
LPPQMNTDTTWRTTSLTAAYDEVPPLATQAFSSFTDNS